MPSPDAILTSHFAISPNRYVIWPYLCHFMTYYTIFIERCTIIPFCLILILFCLHTLYYFFTYLGCSTSFFSYLSRNYLMRRASSLHIIEPFKVAKVLCSLKSKNFMDIGF